MSFSPIDNFTPEILAPILDIASDYTDACGARHCDTVQLATVSKYWRDVIFAHPQIWAHLHLNVQVLDEDSQCDGLVAYLKRWFSRAGTLPLDLSLIFDSLDDDYMLPSDLFQYLADIPRWRSLQLVQVADITLQRLLVVAQQRRGRARDTIWPNMEELVVRSSTQSGMLTSQQSPPVLLEKVIPGIREFEFRIESSIPALSTFFHRFPLSNLTSLEVLTSIRELANPFVVLLQLPKLVSLCMTFGTLLMPAGETAGPAHLLPPVQHMELKTLALRTFPVTQISWLNQLRVPSLESLLIDGHNRYTKIRRPYADPFLFSIVGEVMTFILGSGCKLKDFTLASLPAIGPEDLTGIFSHIPTLRCLTLLHMVNTSISWDGEMETFFENVREVSELGDNLLPNLEYFHFEAHKIKAIADANARDGRGKKLWGIFKSDPVAWWGVASSALL